MNASIRDAIGLLCLAYNVGAPFTERVAAIDEINKAILAAEQAARADERRKVLEECADIASTYCLVPPDGGSPTEDERKLCCAISAHFRALAGKKEGDD